jgi:hypothetical protein
VEEVISCPPKVHIIPLNWLLNFIRTLKVQVSVIKHRSVPKAP